MVIDVFNRGRIGGNIGRDAIIHTDQGSQARGGRISPPAVYRRLSSINEPERRLLRQRAKAESFFSRFKAELLENGRFESLEQAKSEIFTYIEGYYNRTRLHSSLGYLSPLEFEKKLKTEDKIKKPKEQRENCVSLILTISVISLNAEKRNIDTVAKKLTVEKVNLEEIVDLLKSNKQQDAETKIKQFYGEVLDPNKMEDLLKEKISSPGKFSVRKPLLEEELREANEELNKIKEQKKVLDKQKELDIQLVPSAGMVFLLMRFALRVSGYAFNCDGWNGKVETLTARSAAYKKIEKNSYPKDPGHNPLYPHSEVLKADKSSVKATSIVLTDLEKDASEIFAEGPGELHIYPPQNLPN